MIVRRAMAACLAAILLMIAQAAAAIAAPEPSALPAAQELSLPGEVPALVWSSSSGKPKAVLLCIHGLGLYKGAFDSFGKRMAREGIETIALDVRGFGAWQDKPGGNRLDLPACLSDIQAALDVMHKQYAGLPIFILGESMGGAIALRAAAMFPGEIAGLISSVPSGDRFGSGSEKFAVGMHALSEGFDTPMAMTSIVDRATGKLDLRFSWLNDPHCRLMITPNELIAFQHFMDENAKYAERFEGNPVLFVQGCNDKLVRPAGTWDLFDHITAPDRQRVFSAHAEHLIFEQGQFDEDDIRFVVSWLEQCLSKASAKAQLAGVNNDPAKTASAGAGAQVSTASSGIDGKMPTALMGVDYWIELYRNGKSYRCNNKTQFVSGDAIRFHLYPQASGYAYILLTAGTGGDRSVLYPSDDAGNDNFLAASQDYVLPGGAWLWFDNKPGVEKLSLVYSRTPIDAQAYLDKNASLIAYVTADKSGAKDLIPTRMELSWDDPQPVIMPETASGSFCSASAVKVRQRDSQAVLALEIALEHK